MFLEVVVDGGQTDAHEEIQTYDEVDDEEQWKPGVVVERRHPGQQKKVLQLNV